MCTTPHTHTHVYIGVKGDGCSRDFESDDDVVEPEVENEKTQSSIEAPLPAGQVPSPRPQSDPRCDSDGLGPERRPNGPLVVRSVYMKAANSAL